MCEPASGEEHDSPCGPVNGAIMGYLNSIADLSGSAYKIATDSPNGIELLRKVVFPLFFCTLRIFSFAARISHCSLTKKRRLSGRVCEADE